MSIPSERPTKPDLEVDEAPTLRAWEVEAVQSLETQLDKLRSGRACKPCLGSGEVYGLGYVAACGVCDGKGTQ